MKIRLGIWLLPMIAATILVLVWTGTFQAHPDDDEHAAHDKLLRKGLIDSMRFGVSLYNQEPKDVVGCIRVFEGALLTVKPLLHHHKDLQKKIEDGMNDIVKMPLTYQRAFALRAFLDEVSDRLGGQVKGKEKATDKKDGKDLDKKSPDLLPTDKKKDEGDKEKKINKEVPAKDKGKDTDKKDESKESPANTGTLYGKISYIGRPLSIGFVTLIGQDDRKFSANIREDGTFALNKGLAPGKYKVIIEKSTSAPNKNQQVIAIPVIYGSAETTPLEVTISRGKNDFNIDLQG